MITALVNKAHTPCRDGVPPLKREEAEALRANAKDWELLTMRIALSANFASS
jgi:hypothetical protein